MTFNLDLKTLDVTVDGLTLGDKFVVHNPVEKGEKNAPNLMYRLSVLVSGC